MNLLLRLIYTIIQSFRNQPIGFFDTAVMTFRVWPLDLDLNMHMTNSRYLSLMDIGRIDYMIRTGLWAKTCRLKVSPVLGSGTFRWRAGLRCFQKFELHTSVLGWDDKWLYMQQRFMYNGQLISDAMVKGIFIDKQGSIPMVELHKRINLSHESPPLPDKVKLWNQMEIAMRTDADIKDQIPYAS